MWNTWSCKCFQIPIIWWQKRFILQSRNYSWAEMWNVGTFDIWNGRSCNVYLRVIWRLLTIVTFFKHFIENIPRGVIMKYIWNFKSSISLIQQLYLKKFISRRKVRKIHKDLCTRMFNAALFDRKKFKLSPAFKILIKTHAKIYTSIHILLCEKGYLLNNQCAFKKRCLYMY